MSATEGFWPGEAPAQEEHVQEPEPAGWPQGREEEPKAEAEAEAEPEAEPEAEAEPEPEWRADAEAALADE